jgi:hypothetical protein
LGYPDLFWLSQINLQKAPYGEALKIPKKIFGMGYLSESIRAYIWADSRT